MKQINIINKHGKCQQKESKKSAHIWNSGNELFGYYECEKGMEYAAKVQAESPVVARWNDYMQDVLLMEMDPETGAQPLLRQVFLLE